jgi:hypothetical protein
MVEGQVAERGVLTAPIQMWEAEVIGPLAAKDAVGLRRGAASPSSRASFWRTSFLSLFRSGALRLPSAGRTNQRVV